MDEHTKQKSKTNTPPSSPRYCSMSNAAKMIMMAAIGPIICARSANQWHSQYTALSTPETICRCLLLFRRSYTGNTTTELVSTAAPITTNRDVMNVESFGSFTMSPSS